MRLKNMRGGGISSADSRTEKRNYGIDLLRITAMLMIVTVHILSQGGVFGNETAVSAYILDNFLYSIVLCGVNCFALISGFIGYREGGNKHHFSSYMYLWMQVVFYGVVMSAIIGLLGIYDIDIKDFIEAVIPVTRNQYWYFTAYTGVFLAAPYLNRAVKGMDENTSRNCCILFGIAFSLYATVANHFGGDPFGLKEGYSFIWLMLMYFIGAIIKKNTWYKNIKKRMLLCIILGCLALTVAWRFGCEYLTQSILGFSWGEKMLMSYVSPTMVIISVCILLFFSNMDINDRTRKIIKYVSPSVFGVYLIHEQPLIRQLFIKDKFDWVAKLPGIMPTVTIIGIAIGIFAVCVVIDHIRFSLFELIHVRKLLEKGERFVREKLNCM